MLEGLIARWRSDAAVLRKRAASVQAELLEGCAADLEASLASADDTVTVGEAAALAGVAPETIRRAVRAGEIPDLRTNPRGTIRVRATDVAFLSGKARRKAEVQGGGYDAGSHAGELLRLF